MALLDFRGPRLRRALPRGAGFVGVAVALYAAAAVVATWPAIEHVGSHFLAAGGAGHGEATPGDHLQTGWNLWLFGHQLAHGHAPWLDPYSFQPEISPRVDFQGLVFGLPYWPLVGLFGAVVAWNVFTLLTFVAAGGATCAWLRSLDLPPLAALAGGLAFALAPYRVAQSTGHLLGAASLFLPLALYGLEKRSRLLAGLAITAIPLSGQVHLALGAVPFFILYALVRRRPWTALPGVVSAVAAALLVRHYAIAGSLHESGRSLREVGRYSADWIGFVSRHGDGETFVFLGWLTPLLALAGLVVLVALDRRFSLALLLAGAVLVPVVFAVGTKLPTYSLARHVVPGLKVSRVPERLLPIACLALAALLAFAVAWMRPWLALVVLLLVAVDLRVQTTHFAATSADESNTAYAQLRDAPPGRLLDLPVFLPDVHLNSTYLYYDMVAQRERPTGYSTTAPAKADETARSLRPLTCGTPPGQILADLGIRYVAIHGGLYEAFSAGCDARAAAALRSRGFRPLAEDGAVTIFARALLNPALVSY